MEFKEAYLLDITSHTEKKGKFTYLSWAYAVRFLREHFPSATWTVKHFDDIPYKFSPAGCFVEVTVVIDDKEFTQIHPILNYQNKVVNDPDAFMVNTSIQRCLAKAIAIATGIGLSLYSGEDIPSSNGGGCGVKQASPDISVKQFIGGIDFFKNTDKSAEDLGSWFESKSDSFMMLPAKDRSKVVEHLNNTFSWLDEHGKHSVKTADNGENESKLELNI